MRDLDVVFAALATSRFRRRFRLNAQDLSYLVRRPRDIILQHAREFIRDRLAAAQPVNDGRQTPMRGHPVFVAQHATATCCRGCLAKWHDVPRGRELSEQEIDQVVAAIDRWLNSQSVAVSESEQRSLPFIDDKSLFD